jgi:hypothetical protein
MRRILILLVTIGGCASVAFCGSNGWEQGGTTDFEKGVTAFIYGFVAAATLALHVAAVKAWIDGRHRRLSLFIGAVAILAFFMTAYISLSGLVSRSDRITAARQDAVDDKASNKEQIDALTAERRALKFSRASQASVDAAKMLATQATTARIAECGNGEPKQRGGQCRQKETDETAAIKTLGEATANKAATDRADEIDAQLKDLRRKPKGEAGAVGVVNPMTELLSGIVGAWAATLTAWQKAAFAVVYDLCLVAMVIGIEILGEPKPEKAPRKRWWQRQRREPAPEAPQEPVEAVPVAIVETPAAIIPKPVRPKIAASNPSPVASVKRILSQALEAAPGQRVELADLAARYRTVAKAEGKRSVALEQFTTDLDAFAKALGLKRKREDGHLYLLDVQLMPVESLDHNVVKS